MEKNKITYTLDEYSLSLIWKSLYESGHEDQAAELAENMIEQGCQELVGVDDMSLILMFWKNYLEKNNLIKFTNNLH
jgi:hypothetical protein|tara:strand:+ start:184 stop:414 length:231 start_codon:yes stop_codon:yes gene_type:complete